MPITKQQSEVPGVSQEVATMQERVDELEKRNKELEAQLAGKIAQASSASLHNYPEADIDLNPPAAEQQKVPQPRTGASAIAKET